MEGKFQLIDSHVHLCPLENTGYLEGVGPGHILYRNNTLAEYLENNTSEKFDKKGVVVVEMAVESSAESEAGWTNALKEFQYHAQVIDNLILGQPGEFIRGVIPWAPVALGKEAVAEYLQRLQTSGCSKELFERVKGFRYVLQDKSSDAGLRPRFLAGLQYLQEKGYVFDLGIDLQDGGLGQLKEAAELVAKLPELKFIVDHLTKPDFYVTRPNEEFNEWRYYMEQISKVGNSYMKLSGCFEGLPDKFVLEHSVLDIVQRLDLWFEAILQLYGPQKIIFGSNWPMDNTNGDQFDTKAFEKWTQVVEALLDKHSIPSHQRQDIYYYNCISLYNLTSQ